LTGFSSWQYGCSFRAPTFMSFLLTLCVFPEQYCPLPQLQLPLIYRGLPNVYLQSRPHSQVPITFVYVSASWASPLTCSIGITLHMSPTYVLPLPWLSLSE
jgi:hypothetical protein